MVSKQGEAVVRVTFLADGKASLNLVGRTLADLNALCELVVALSSPKYMDRVRGAKDWRVRRGSRLQSPDQLGVRSIRLASPLVMDILVPTGIGSAAVWALVQAVEKVEHWQSERRLRSLRERRETIGLERDKIALERDQRALEKESLELDRLISERQAADAFTQAANRLADDLPIAAVYLPHALPPSVPDDEPG